MYNIYYNIVSEAGNTSNDSWYNVLKDFSPSLITLLLGIFGILIALKKHKENIEIQKKQDLIKKQQKIAMDLIDDLILLKRAVLNMTLIFREISDDLAEENFKDIKIVSNKQRNVMLKKLEFEKHREIINKVLNYSDYFGLYFPEESFNSLYKIYDIIYTLENTLNLMIKDSFYTENSHDIIDENYKLIKLEVGKGSTDSCLDDVIKEIISNMKKYLKVDILKWDSILEDEDRFEKFNWIKKENNKK